VALVKGKVALSLPLLPYELDEAICAYVRLYQDVPWQAVAGAFQLSHGDLCRRVRRLRELGFVDQIGTPRLSRNEWRLVAGPVGHITLENAREVGETIRRFQDERRHRRRR
jgi:hypothetical protein